MLFILFGTGCDTACPGKLCLKSGNHGLLYKIGLRKIEVCKPLNRVYRPRTFVFQLSIGGLNTC